METKPKQSVNKNLEKFDIDKAWYVAGLLLLHGGLILGIVGIWQYVVYGVKTEWLLRVLHSHSAWIGVIVILFASVKHILKDKKRIYHYGADLVFAGIMMGFGLYFLFKTNQWRFIETSLVRVHTHTIFYAVFLLLSYSLLTVIKASERAKKAVVIFYSIALAGILVFQPLFVVKGLSPIFTAALESAIFLAHITVIHQLIKFIRKQLNSEERTFGIFWLYSFIMIFFLTAVGVYLMLNIIIPTQYQTAHGLYWYDKGPIFRAIEDLHLSPISWFTSGIAISLGILALRMPMGFQVFALTLLAVAPTLNAIGRLSKVLSLTLPDAGVSIFGSGIKYGIAVLWLGAQPMKIFVVTLITIFTIYWIRKNRKASKKPKKKK